MSIGQRLKEYDHRWSEKVRIVDRKGKLRTLAVLFAHSGDSLFILPIFALFWWLGNAFWSYRGKVLLIAVLAIGAIVQVIKWTFRRKRPVGNWGGIVRKTDPHSFPSGHAAKAGLLLGLGLYLGPEFIRIAVLIYAPLMAFSRTQVGIHYLSDVIAGFTLGIISSGAIIFFFI